MEPESNSLRRLRRGADHSPVPAVPIPLSKLQRAIQSRLPQSPRLLFRLRGFSYDLATPQIDSLSKRTRGAIYSVALKPDAVFYLRIGIDQLLPRVVFSRGFDYSESGMDLFPGHDMFDSEL